MKSPKLSVVVLVHNEAASLEACLQSVKDIAWEIIVVDADSNDNSAAIAKQFTKHVYPRPNNLLLNPNKNFGFQKATGEWILNLDADEKVTPELAEEINKVIDSQNDTAGYWIARKNIVFGKWIEHSIWWPDYQMRLFKNGKGRFAEKHVHELLEVDGTVGKLQQPMIHVNYTSISQWIRKMDTIYTENEVTQRLEKGEHVTPLDVLRYPAHDFLQTYFFQKGYKDGLHGLVLSILQAFYAEIVFAKIWEKEGFIETSDPKFREEVIRELKKIGYEFRYWIMTVVIDHTDGMLEKTFMKVKRKVILRKLKKNE